MEAAAKVLAEMGRDCSNERAIAQAINVPE
jgi:hypothetical protein